LQPLIDLLAYDDNEEIQCHAISTLRNLAASSERNKRAIVEAGAVERIRELVLQVPLSVQSEMTAAVAVLALSEELKGRILSESVLEVLVPLTGSASVEVCGNAAAAIGNLSGKVRDYTPFLQVWDQPSGGLHGYLLRFLDESQDPAFQHIAIWTLVQFLEGGDSRLHDKIYKSSKIIAAVGRIAQEVPLDDVDGGDEGDIDGDMFMLARRVVGLVRR